MPNYISVRSYKWARGNLYKSGSNFYFEASQTNYHGGATEGGFIGWNTLDIGVAKYNLEGTMVYSCLLWEAEISHLLQ